MGLVGRFERKLESSVGDAFARVFGGAIVPQEVEAILQREAEAGAREVGGGRILAPNDYVITLSVPDHQKVSADPDLRSTTFARYLEGYIHDHGWQTYGEVVVSFEPSPNLYTGQFRTRGAVNPDSTRGEPAQDARNRAYTAEPGVPAMSDNPSYRGQGQGQPGDEYYEYGRPAEEPRGPEQGGYPPQGAPAPGYPPPRQAPYDQAGYAPEHGGYPDQGYPPPSYEQRPPAGYGPPPGGYPDQGQRPAPPAGYGPPPSAPAGYGQPAGDYDYGRPPAAPPGRHEEYGRPDARPAYPDQGGYPDRAVTPSRAAIPSRAATARPATAPRPTDVRTTRSLRAMTTANNLPATATAAATRRPGTTTASSPPRHPPGTVVRLTVPLART